MSGSTLTNEYDSLVMELQANFAALIKPSFKKDLGSYLKNKAPVSFLSELVQFLHVSQTYIFTC
jgi:hypothetical protein